MLPFFITAKPVEKNIENAQRGAQPMIIKNTPENRTLARKAREAIDVETGFRAIVARDWNCGADIRIEVSTANTPFIVMTSIEDGILHLNVRMQPVTLDEVDILELKYRLDSVDKIASRLQKLVEELKPRV